MSPEVAREEKLSIDGWTAADMYSFGAVLFELGALRRPWVGLSDVQILTKVAFKGEALVLRADQCTPSDAGGEVEAKAVEGFLALANKCLDADPSRRPRIRAALDDIETA